jgi:hypothetical protein
MNSREQNHMNHVTELNCPRRGTLSARIRDVRVRECERSASQQKTPFTEGNKRLAEDTGHPQVGYLRE